MSVEPTMPIFWEKHRQAQLEIQADWPVVKMLRERLTEIEARIYKGVAYARTWPSLDWGERNKADRLLHDLVTELLNIQELLNGKLPKTNICICRSCKAILLPSIRGTEYRCCGAFWAWDNRAAYKPLPLGFWEKHMPGERFKGRLEDNFILQEQGRDEHWRKS